MIIKYKVSDFAKDTDQSTKKVLELLAPLGGEPKKVGSNLEESELNYLLEKLSRENAEANLGDYLACAAGSGTDECACRCGGTAGKEGRAGGAEKEA